MHYSNTTSCTWTFYILNNCSAIRDICFLGKSCKQIWLASYGSKRASQSLSSTPFMHILPCLTIHDQYTGRIWTFYISNYSFTIKHVPCVVQSCIRDPTLEIHVPGTHLWVSNTALLSIYFKSVHTSLSGAQLRMTTKLTYFMTTSYIPNDSFIANNASFCKTNLASYSIHVAVSF